MTQTEISYMLWEIIRAGQIVDDERLDIRLLNDWVDLKRAKFVRQDFAKNPNSRISLNTYQKLPVTVSIVSVTDAGDYPYNSIYVQDYELVESDITIPSIVEGKSGPLILSLESEDAMKLPFSVVDYDHLRFAGNGKFNSGIIFGSIRDNKIYFKYNPFFSSYTNVVLRAIFEKPSEVTGFNPDTDRYPLDANIIDYLKNAILDEDINKFLKGVTDEVSDSTGQIK